MTQVVIFDDDAQAALSIKNKVERYERINELEVTCVYTTDELRAYAKKHGYPDILLADIMLPSDMNGIEVVQKYFPASTGTQVIFVSGALDNVLDAYRAEHIYFLLKPIEQDKLNDALDKCLKRLEQKPALLYEVKSKSNPAVIRVSSIIYVESNARKVRFHTITGVFEEYAKLDEVQAKLPKTFIRIHKSYLINAYAIIRTGSDSLTTTDKTVLPISKSHAKETHRFLLDYAKGRL